MYTYLVHFHLLIWTNLLSQSITAPSNNAARRLVFKHFLPMKRFYRLSQNSHSESVTSQRVILEGDHDRKNLEGLPPTSSKNLKSVKSLAYCDKLRLEFLSRTSDIYQEN